MQKKIDFILDFFKTYTFDSGRTIYCLKDHTPKHVEDFVREVHGTDMLPDDFRFASIYELLVRFSEYAKEDENLELIYDDIPHMVDVYTHDLLKWLGSNLTRTSYVDDAMSMHAAPKFVELIVLGQELEIQEIAGNILSKLEDFEV